MRRLLVRSTVLVLTAASVGLSVPAEASGTAPARTERTERTAFAFQTSAFGTRSAGGTVPVESDTTAFQSIGCTNVAGLVRSNYEAETEVPGLGQASGVRTSLWTRNRNGVVSSNSRHDIAQVTLASTPAGTLTVNGIHSFSQASHSGAGFRTVTRTDIASIALTGPDGQSQTFAVPAPGRSVSIPGVATLSAGDATTNRTASGASARTSALIVDVVATGTQVRIAQTTARIMSGIRSGLFSGYSAGTRVSAVQESVRSGYTPLEKMRCQGTRGKVQGLDIAHLDLGAQLVVDGLSTRQRAGQGTRSATGFEQGRIARVELGDQRLVATGVVGRVTVTRRGSTVERSTLGSTIGSLTVDGQAQRFPDTGVIEIPGVLKLERNVTTRLDGGLAVVALRVTVLDPDAENTGAVIDLGTARLRIRRAH